MTHPALTYRQVAIQGATPVGLVVMLYDGAIAWLQRAITAIEAHDIEKKSVRLNRALSIIVQLESVLNFDQGGEIAQNLKRFYGHARTSVLQASIKNSKEILTSLIQQFSELREAWQQVEAQGSSPSTPAPTPHDARPSSTPPLNGAGESAPWSA
jgi:flagellar protein FliS